MLWADGRIGRGLDGATLQHTFLGHDTQLEGSADAPEEERTDGYTPNNIDI